MDKVEINIKYEELESYIEKLSRRNRDVHGIMIYKDGKRIFKKTYNEYDQSLPHGIYSCTKSILSLLIGIAIDNGFIDSTDIPIKNLLKKYEKYFDTKDKSLISLKDILTMRSGIEWDELNGFGKNDGLWSQFLNCNDSAEFVLGKKSAFEANKEFNYNSATSHLLSIIISENTGSTTLEFAQKYLFDKLDIKFENVKWETDKNDIVYGGHGMSLTIDDLEKIGILYLEKGFYNNARVVSEKWIKESTTIYSKNVRSYAGYGYQLWIGDIKGEKFYAAFGHGGQRIYIFEDLNLVITFLGDVKPEFGIQEKIIREFIF